MMSGAILRCHSSRILCVAAQTFRSTVTKPNASCFSAARINAAKKWAAAGLATVSLTQVRLG